MPSAPDDDQVFARRRQIGAELRDARLAAGLTQEEVANLIGLDRPSVVRIEAGQVDPRLSTLLRLGAAVGLRLRLEGE